MEDKYMKFKLVTEVAAAGVAAFAIAWAYGGAVKAQDAEYVGHASCKMCHNKAAEGEQHNKWSQSKHAKAFETLKTDHAKEVAASLNIEKPPAEAPECLRCHVTGYDMEEKALPAKLKAADGVQCEACHGPSGDHVALARKALTDKTIDVTVGRDQASEENCKTCHNTDSPTWDTTRYVLEDGTTVGFDYEQAWKMIAHENPLKQE
jgi:hypothetical protein